MTDGDLSRALAAMKAIEQAARAYWQASPLAAERDAALQLVRQVTPVIRSVEQWIVSRATGPQT